MSSYSIVRIKSLLELVSMEAKIQQTMMRQPNNKRPVMEKRMSKSLFGIKILIIISYEINYTLSKLRIIALFFFFASPKKETKNASLMIFFCKISLFFSQHHPDRLSSRFIRRLALWVAPSASAKKITYFTTKNIIWRSSLICLQIMFRTWPFNF